MTELERAVRLQRRVTLFWIVVTMCGLVFCLIGAAWRTPGLYTTWRGAALLALSAVYAGWMLGSQLWRGRRAPTMPCLRRRVHIWLTAMVLTAGLFALQPMTGWLCYALFGMAFSLFELPWAVLPGLVAYAFIPATVVANGFAPVAAIANPGSLIGWACAFPLYAAMTYIPSWLMRERIRREAWVAELERVHGELAEAHGRLAASASQDRELAVLRERGRLARDMHDTLGHALVLVAVKLEAARRLRDVDAPRADRELAATQQIVRDAMADLRACLAALRSPVLGREPLGELLAQRAHEAGARAGWQVVADVSPELGPVADALHEALLRVGCEALTNAERHAHARSVTLTLHRTGDGALLLRVADDGVGLGVAQAARTPDIIGARAASHVPTSPAVDSGNPDRDPARLPTAERYGITGMRERIAALGGAFALTSGPRGGTVVEARVPTVPVRERSEVAVADAVGSAV
jgi:signal transduction histidine kinase